jgi:hypothetical protein
MSMIYATMRPRRIAWKASRYCDRTIWLRRKRGNVLTERLRLHAGNAPGLWNCARPRAWRDCSRSRGVAKRGVRGLAEIYDWFTEGFDTADLKDAKALLDELSNSL